MTNETIERASNDRGAAAILVALMVVLLVGMAAYVIDVGSLFQERRELQNGADAGALAIAHDCAAGSCGNKEATADIYANANAGDGDSAVAQVSFPTANSVKVDLVTADAGPNRDGDTSTVDFQFAGVFGQTGEQVSATATAAWGGPSSLATLPITFGLCEFNISLGQSPTTPPPTDGTVFGSADESAYTVLFFHTGEGGNGNGNNNNGNNNNGNNGGGGNEPPISDAQRDCYGVAGSDVDNDGSHLPGGFGWLQDGSDCEVTIDANNWVAGKPGNGPPNSCDPSDLLGSTVYIPLFDQVHDQGDPSCPAGSPGDKCYRIFGFIAFEVSGFRFPGNGSGWSQNAPCNPPHTCLAGNFVRFVSEQPGDLGGPNLGFNIVKLTG